MKTKKVSVILFFVMLTLLPTIGILVKGNSFSLFENRELTKYKAPTLTTVFDGSFMNNTEMYLKDNFLFRNTMLKTKTDVELLQGKTNVNGVYVTKNRLFKKLKKPDKTVLNNNVQAINGFIEKYSHSISGYMMLVPTAAEFYKVDLPVNIDPLDQTTCIQNIYSTISNKITTVDAYASLSSHKDEYIYYKTHNSWTSLGAYYAYATLVKHISSKPVVLDMFNIEHASYDFLGNLYRQVFHGEDLCDSINLYHYSKGAAVSQIEKFTTPQESKIYDGLYFKEFLDSNDKHKTFLGDDAPVVKIATNSTTNKKIVIFKDDFINPMLQFISLHYSEIVLIDLKMLEQPLLNYINLYQYDDVLFLYNITSMITNSDIQKLFMYA